jgi:hypothetical protein
MAAEAAVEAVDLLAAEHNRDGVCRCNIWNDVAESPLSELRTLAVASKGAPRRASPETVGLF